MPPYPQTLTLAVKTGNSTPLPSPDRFSRKRLNSRSETRFIAPLKKPILERDRWSARRKVHDAPGDFGFATFFLDDENRSLLMNDLRIISFLPAATEMACALGLGNQLVGVTHECDFPSLARSNPVVVRNS